MKFIRNKLIWFLVKNLLAGVTEKDILTVTNRGWFQNRRKLSPEEVENLKEEANSLKSSVLWDLMEKEIRYLANLSMFEKGLDRESTIFGRAMLYNLQLLEQFINRCSKL